MSILRKISDFLPEFAAMLTGKSDREPIDSVGDLHSFVATRSAYIAQKTLYDRVHAGAAGFQVIPLLPTGILLLQPLTERLSAIVVTVVHRCIPLRRIWPSCPPARFRDQAGGAYGQ